jgi:hypothetical protein
VEHNEWMNDQVKEEIEALRRTHGFEENEALARCHLMKARKLINALRHADVLSLGEDRSRGERWRDE